ncbi:hypothetical protein CRUP_013849 [Coryphaenoides rupestris]|nr:hypothetical protein CRUP_013849 [Coryphaenoides rupestris]
MRMRLTTQTRLDVLRSSKTFEYRRVMRSETRRGWRLPPCALWFRLLVVLLFFISFVTYYCSYAVLQSLGCRTCVVVGNGFSIKNTSLGSVIDKHHVVIRLNDAPVRGYEEDVGEKTTMRLFYPESASYDPGLHNNPDTLMVLVPFKQQDLHWLKAIVHNEKRVRKGFWKLPPLIWLGDTSKIRVLDPHYLHQTADRLLQIPLHSNNRKPVHPTTGILAVFVALNYCDVVHIVGFGYPSAQRQNRPIHYYGYDTIKSMTNSYHDVNHEADALSRLEDLGAIVNLHPHT